MRCGPVGHWSGDRGLGVATFRVSASSAREVQLPAFRGMPSRRRVASVAALVSPGTWIRLTPGLRAQLRKASEQLGVSGDKQYGITVSGIRSRGRAVSTGKSAHQYVQCQYEDVSDVASSSVTASGWVVVSGSVLPVGVVESDWPLHPHSRIEQAIKARPHN